MDLLDRLLGHDAWTTRQLLEICNEFSDEQLDSDFDIGHRTLRATFEHIIQNMEIWSCLMAGEPICSKESDSISAMSKRLDEAAARIAKVARGVTERHGWDELWTDYLDEPPTEKSFGSSIAHVITHSMHHRAQILNMLRQLGVTKIPEGDVFSWESQRN